MKKYSILMMLLASLLIYGCTKDAHPVTPLPVPTFTVNTVSLPVFTGSSWINVTGGEVLAQFDKLNESGTVTSTIADSIAYTNLNSYSKILASGTYNVTLASTSKNAADIFIRFNAQIKSLSITDKEAESLTATTNDGLITINQNLVQSGTVPTFKPDGGAISYKFGLVNGFYYLYVTGGTNGTLALSVQASGQTQTLSKHISIVSLTQNNVALQTSNSSIQIVFAPFAYNQELTSSSTLLTVNINPNNYLVTNGTVYFVATDANGNVLNSVQYKPGTSTFKIAALAPYEQTRFSFFEIFIPNSTNVVPSIAGYLQVKKGSTFNSDLTTLQGKPSSALNIQFQNFTAFDGLNVSSDGVAYSASSVSDLSSINVTSYSTGSQLWVQMLKNNQYFYNFFDIPAAATSLNVDVNQLTKTPNAATITSPGNNLQVEVFAKTDTNYSNAYNFGFTRSQYNKLTYYYPAEKFEQYDALMFYSIGKLNYVINTAGTTIPSQAASVNASFNVQASNLATFVPSISGSYDYYEANFLDLVSANKLQVTLYSPSAAGYTNIKLPDFSKYLGVTSVDLSKLPLKFFGVYQVDGFNESIFDYKNYHSYNNINSKAIEENF